MKIANEFESTLSVPKVPFCRQSHHAGGLLCKVLSLLQFIVYIRFEILTLIA